MKLNKYFEKLLNDSISLPETKLDTLIQKVETLTNFISNSDGFKDIYQGYEKQGSFANKTIIKPAAKNKEFDADILIINKKQDDWEPKDYINNLYNIFNSSERYKDKVTKNDKCININYASDFNIDIVPCIKDDDDYIIFDKALNKELITKPINFNKWFKDKNTSSKSNLKIVVKLYKYLRDRKQSFTIKSIMCNTLFGNEIDNLNFNQGDIAQGLYDIFDNVNNYLQENENMPIVKNPVLESENLSKRCWKTEAQYESFRSIFNNYYEKIKAAFDETDKNLSIEKWQKLIPDFPDTIEEKKNESSNTVVGFGYKKPYLS